MNFVAYLVPEKNYIPTTQYPSPTHSTHPISLSDPLYPPNTPLRPTLPTQYPSPTHSTHPLPLPDPLYPPTTPLRPTLPTHYPSPTHSTHLLPLSDPLYPPNTLPRPTPPPLMHAVPLQTKKFHTHKPSKAKDDTHYKLLHCATVLTGCEGGGWWWWWDGDGLLLPYTICHTVPTYIHEEHINI